MLVCFEVLLSQLVLCWGCWVGSQEEIFGPLLPVIAVDSIDDAIAFVNDRPQPLALYVFTASSKTAERVLGNTTSGGACVNDAIMHCTNPHLPFGGTSAPRMLLCVRV